MDMYMSLLHNINVKRMATLQGSIMEYPGKGRMTVQGRCGGG
jgi:hypothetical protein